METVAVTWQCDWPQTGLVIQSCSFLHPSPATANSAIQFCTDALRRCLPKRDVPDVLRGNAQLPSNLRVDATEVGQRNQFPRCSLNSKLQFVAPVIVKLSIMLGFTIRQGLFVPARARNANTDSEVAKRIRSLRESRGETQTAFAAALDTQPSAVSKWEAGRNKPFPEVFVRLASLADGIDKLFFLEHAGLPPEYFEGSKMVPEIEEAAGKVVSRAFNENRKELDSVPLLKDPVAAGNPRNITESDILDRLPRSRRLMPRGGDLYAFRVSGDSMAPIICDGYVVMIDAAQRDPKRLVGHMVAAREADGITIKWLRKDKDSYLLVPQHISPRIPVRIMRPEDDWAIVGEVVSWIGYPPPTKK